MDALATTPIDDRLTPNVCDCVFTPDPEDEDENTPETAWHYLRRCAGCQYTWYGLHCPHDGFQNPCPQCKLRPATVPCE